MTPFEKVMGVYKKAEMLIESVRHDWHFSRKGGGAIYSGSYTGLTCDTAHVLNTLFEEAGAWTWISARIVSVECPITAEESVWINRKRGYRG